MNHINWHKLTEVQWKAILDEEQRKLLGLSKDAEITLVIEDKPEKTKNDYAYLESELDELPLKALYITETTSPIEELIHELKTGIAHHLINPSLGKQLLAIAERIK